MRLSKDKIKQGILDADPMVREAAAMHFAVAYTEDRSVMPTVTDAIDKFGYEEAFSDIDAFQTLPQSDPSITWLTNEIARIGKPADRKQFEYIGSLSWILAEADASLLKRRRKDVFDLRYLDANARESIQQRTRLLSLPKEKCWEDFEHYCEQLGNAPQGQDKTALARVYQLLEVISHHPEEFGGRLLASLQANLSDRTNLTEAWKQACAVQAAGQMRLSQAIPRLTELLQSAREEWVREDCVIALVRIGGDEVVKSVWNACAVAPEEFQDYAAWILECVHSDLAAEAALHLMEQSQVLETKAAFAHALLSDYSIDGLGRVRQLVLSHPDAEGMSDLRDSLVAVCSLMGAELPELEEWRAQTEKEQEFLAQWQSPEFPVVDTWTEKPEQAEQPRRSKLDPMLLPLRIPRKPRPQGVGRNDPCPCNSGKKYKQCCLRNR